MNRLKTFLFGTLLLLAGNAMAQSQSEPIKHVLLLDWVENPDSTAQAEVYALFENLPGKIEGFESIRFKKVILSNANFDEVVIMTFTNQEALDAYQEHEDHLRIKALAKSLLVSLTKYDYTDS
jgi:hypothetical protein